MSSTKSRRQFLSETTLTLLATATSFAEAQNPPASQTPGMPPAFGTAPAAGPKSHRADFVEPKSCPAPLTKPTEQAACNWRNAMAPLYERRIGPRKLAIPPTFALLHQSTPCCPANPTAPPQTNSSAPRTSRPSPNRRLTTSPSPPSHKLARWIQTRKLTTERLTKIYLERIEQLQSQPELRHHAHRGPRTGAGPSRRREIAAGQYRGPLHGIPWGAKDLLDTANIPTTYGAEPFRNRIPTADATVIQRLNEAGAVLIAKLSLGALALNDIWFGGQTMNPWLLEEGSSGSSAGPGAATAAGLVGFAIGSETGGSIVSPPCAVVSPACVPPMGASLAPAP